jgi:hypothetical protein
MIEFVELEPFETKDGSSEGNKTLIPVYMVKGGEMYFVMNCTSSKLDIENLANIKTELIRNGCRYFKFYGYYDDPEQMIAEMIVKGNSFIQPDKLFHYKPSNERGVEYTDFRGNQHEVSDGFYYRIYDKSFATKLVNLVSALVGNEREKGKKVQSAAGSAVMLSRDGVLRGRIINFRARRCGMEGCNAYRASVRWEDGSLTYPCMRGVKAVSKGLYQII